MNPFEELSGTPLLSLLKLALQKRTKAAQEKNQNLHFRITNTKFARNIQSYLKSKRMELILKERYREIRSAPNRENVKESGNTGEPEAKRFKMDISETTKTDVQEQRRGKIPNILRKSLGNRTVQINQNVANNIS